jgi:hypothetical protein
MITAIVQKIALQSIDQSSLSRLLEVMVFFLLRALQKAN